MAATSIEKIQEALADAGLDGWLFYDFQNRDPMAYRVLGLDPKKITTRRWYYYIPAHGVPQKLVHSIEASRLDALPGDKKIYLPWQEQHALLREILAGAQKVAMQYSPLNAIPYISLVDAGTVDLVRSFGVQVVSSADLIGRFEALVGPRGYALHREAGSVIHDILDRVWTLVARGTTTDLTEYDLQQFIISEFQKFGLTCGDHAPIVAVNDHAGDPHFEPTPDNSRPIRRGDLLLVDLWARKNVPDGIYYDVTWMAFVGTEVPHKFNEVFEIVKRARNEAVAFLRERFSRGEPVFGYEVDRVCRSVVAEAGYGQRFIHRTGHSIGEEVHGNGVNLDDLETKDERRIVPGCLFSIEPGIYLDEFGVRSEINVYIEDGNSVVVTEPEQREIVRIGRKLE